MHCRNIFAALKPHLRPFDLPFGEVVGEPGKFPQRVYFPHTSVISMIVEMEGGPLVETAMTGRDGVVNGMSALGRQILFAQNLVQIEGPASVIHPDPLRSIAKQFELLSSLLMRHEQVILAETQQSAGCNASHFVEERICRWLLRVRELTQSDDIQLIQAFLAQMLGVRRTSVTLVASKLQTAGLINYRRGSIKINDIERMRKSACECCEKVQSYYNQMVHRQRMHRE